MIELLALWAGSYHLDMVPHNPPCAIYDTCKYMPNPAADGPLMPVWNTGNAGWTTLPIQCNVSTYQCNVWAPQG